MGTITKWAGRDRRSEDEPAPPGGLGLGWQHPVPLGKRLGSHLGGSRDPLVISWPARIKDTGGSVNGADVAKARLSRTVPVKYSHDETFDVGEDGSSPVGPYAGPFPFTG
jgi:hypothetical protein